ncbi:hypothetical protein [Pseudooctadecabacter sp.]|uniref:hypothetical protein n=1 Tax=Pseudooctadecabacter sp. TaxID=1966338 RepID=UPI0025F773B0|nr:hypothetical protein [Pseudooctadecabacter sp.]
MSTFSDITDSHHVRREAHIPLPAPQPFGLPVLISDCSTSLCGQTVLSLLWQRFDQDDRPD